MTPPFMEKSFLFNVFCLFRSFSSSLRGFFFLFFLFQSLRTEKKRKEIEMFEQKGRSVTRAGSLHIRLIGGFNIDQVAEPKSTSSFSVTLSLEQRKQKTKRAPLSLPEDTPFASPFSSFGSTSSSPSSSSSSSSSSSTSLNPLWGDSFTFPVANPLSSLFLTLNDHREGDALPLPLAQSELVLASVADGQPITLRVPFGVGKEGWWDATKKEDNKEKEAKGGLEMVVQYKYTHRWGPIYDALQACSEGDPKNANKMLSTAIDDPSYEALPTFFGVLLCYRSLCRVKLGQFDLAIEDAKRSLDIDESVGEEAYYIVGLAFETTGQLDRALSSYREGRKFVRDPAESELVKRLEALDEEKQRDPPSQRFVEMYAKDAIKKGDYKSAATQLGHLTKQLPQDCHAFFARGLVKIAQGDLPSGILDVKEGLRLDPDWPFRDTEHEGTMEKKGEGTLSIFRTRHFRLKNRFLFYYADPHTQTPNGFVTLLLNTKITSRPSRPLEFQICTPTRKYEIRADSETKSSDWMQALEDQIVGDFTLPSSLNLSVPLPSISDSIAPGPSSPLPRRPTTSPPRHATSPHSPKRASPSPPPGRESSPRGAEREGKPFLARVDSIYPALFGTDNLQKAIVKRDLKPKTKGVSQWTEEEVLKWVEEKNFPEEIEMAFRKNNIDGALLAELTMQTLKTEMGISSLGHRQKVLKAIAQADQDGGQWVTTYFVENRKHLPKPFSLGKVLNAQMNVPVYKLALSRSNLPSDQDLETFLVAAGRCRALGPTCPFRVWEVALQIELEGELKAFPLSLDISSPLPTPTIFIPGIGDGKNSHKKSSDNLSAVKDIFLLSDRFDGHLHYLLHPSEGSLEKVLLRDGDAEFVCLAIAQQFLLLERNSIFLPNSILTSKNILWRLGKAFDWESGPLQICNLDVLVFPFPFVEGEEEQEGTWNLPKEERLGRLRRWGAPELRHMNSSSQFAPESSTLVWNLALILWSLFMGNEPYPGVPTSQLTTETRLPFLKPNGWSDNLYTILSSCIARDASQRPDLSSLCNQLQSLCQ